MTERDVGVPGAVAEALRLLAEKVPTRRLDRIWIFPPRVVGRRESGLVAAGCYGEGDGRVLVTLAYRAEETATGISFRPVFQEEGEAPEDRLATIMQGVVSRSKEALGVPRSVVLGGDPEAFRKLMEGSAAPDPPHTGSSEPFPDEESSR
jgi:hypothetical protein